MSVRVFYRYRMLWRKAGKFGDGTRVVNPIFDVSIKQFDVVEALSKTARGPV